MKTEWQNTVITKIAVALYVPPNTAKLVHKDRAYHGFVLNSTDTEIDYHFSDGFTLHTVGGALYYLPKGSSYSVKSIKSHGCYAINFDAEITESPTLINIKNTDSLKKRFKTACDEWLSDSAAAHSAAMRAIYEVIFLAQKEEYIPSHKHNIISPAQEMINKNFTSPDISVSSLAQLCGVSEVYFRKIFISCCGISPKEYIIVKRMEYAKELLSSGEFEVSKIAEMCGYPAPCHFSREFKRRFGVSPNNYQKH